MGPEWFSCWTSSPTHMTAVHVFLPLAALRHGWWFLRSGVLNGVLLAPSHTVSPILLRDNGVVTYLSL